MSQLDIFGLEGRVAIVGGGGGAIGAALAEAMAGAGARVAVAGRTLEALEAAVERVRVAGSEGLAVEADMTSEADCERMVQATWGFGRIDIMVNAVGGGAGAALYPAEAYPRDSWDWIMDLNRAAGPADAGGSALDDRARRWRAVLNLSSVRANLGINAGYSAYVAAKGAISALTRQWATEWAKHGIRVNALMPTFVDTPQVASLLADPAFKAGVVGRIPLGRIAETRELAGPAIFLVSDAASFVTGHILSIDGGLTATQ
jgi:gluconate 5-dehydrogenase